MFTCGIQQFPSFLYSPFSFRQKFVSLKLRGMRWPLSYRNQTSSPSPRIFPTLMCHSRTVRNQAAPLLPCSWPSPALASPHQPSPPPLYFLVGRRCPGHNNRKRRLNPKCARGCRAPPCPVSRGVWVAWVRLGWTRLGFRHYPMRLFCDLQAETGHREFKYLPFEGSELPELRSKVSEHTSI